MTDRRVSPLVAYFSLLAVATGILVMFAWVTEIDQVKSIVPGLATMKFNTALSFVLAGCGLWFLRRRPTRARHLLTARGCALAVLLLAALTTGEYVFGWDLGIDQWAVRDMEGPYPGRMSAATGICFLLLGAALLALSARAGASLSQALSVFVLLAGLVALQGYVYGAAALFSFFLFSSMALHTATIFVLLGLGTLLARPDLGFVAVFSSPMAGGRLLRPMVPLLAVVTSAVGWLILQGQLAQLYQAEMSLALLSTATIVGIACVAWWLAGRLNAQDAALRTTEIRFRGLLESLPQLVWTCLGDGPCDYLSPQWVAYTGVPEGEQLGYRWLEQLHPDDRERVKNEWAATAPGSRPFDIEFRIRRYDGVYRWFKTRATPLLNSTGSVTKWLGSNTDIQDLRDAQDALHLANRELETRVRERTRESTAATDAARAIAAQLSTAQRVAKIGSWQLDVATGHVHWTEQLFRIVGLEPEAGAPRFPDQARFFTEESWRRLSDAIQQSVRTAEGYELELELRRPDGATRWCITRAEAGLGTDGRVAVLTGTFQDVTEVKEVQLALARTTERVQLATAAAHIGVWDWDVRDNVLNWDSTMYRLYGAREEEFSGAYEAWRNAVHPDDLAQAEQDLNEALVGSHSFNTAFRIIHGQSGAVRYLRGAAVVHTDKAGRPRRLVGVNWDVSEQREAELALLASEQLLREFVSHAPAAIAMLDREMRYVQTSERWLLDYNVIGRDIIGRSHYEVFPEIPERWKEIHRRVLAGAVERGDDDPFPRADGTLDWLQWEARPWLTADGKVGGLLFFTQVITERKQMEVELRNQKAALEHSNAELAQFAYVASHDLQEPLRAVAGCSQILKRRYAAHLDANAEELIQHVVDGADRMHLLIDDLLAYSRVDRQHLEPEPIDSGESLQVALANLQAAVEESSAVITHDALPKVHADRGQLVQLFQNIVSNAVKYRSLEPPRIHIEVVQTRSEWEFRIRDNGIGIDPQYFERIFSLFQRLHTRTEYPGTGIGLAICKKIVQRHSGRIWVEPAPGHGAVFCFTLPLQPSSAT